MESPRKWTKKKCSQKKYLNLLYEAPMRPFFCVFFFSPPCYLLDLRQEDWNACNPLQVGFARLFCDVHCVRDAVIRGDRSIIRNLEKATKKTNNNMAALVKWSVDSARTETGWIADKIDPWRRIQHSIQPNLFVWGKN